MSRKSSRRTARRSRTRNHSLRSHSSLGCSPFGRRLRLEPLEDRRLLAVVTVTTLSDTVDFNDGVTSLREAIFATNVVPGADTINFDSALTTSGPASILLTHGELKITDSLTIDGPGADLLTIDASGNDPTPDVNDRKGSRVFDVDDSNSNIVKSVSLTGMTLTGGDIYGNGGAILSRENLTITNCKISGNAVGGDTRGFGGGVYCGSYSGSSLPRLTIQNSYVSGNLSNKSGGGVATIRADLTVIGSAIFDNRAINGGGIFGRDGKVSISFSGFYFNYVDGSGGGISRTGGTTTISASQVCGNRAGTGGGLDSAGSAVTITGSSFSANTAQSGDGGAIRNGGGSLTISGSTVRDNWARDGGGVFGASTITGCEISSNRADRDGGGIWGSSLDVLDSAIAGNYASGRGGAIYCRGGHLTVERSTLSGNQSGQSGSGVFDGYYGQLTLSASTITGNVSLVGSGGGVYAFAGLSGQSTIDHCTMVMNAAGVFGGGVAFIGGKLVLDHSIVATNFAFLGPDVTGLLNTNVQASFSLIGDNANSGLTEATVGAPDANGNLIGGPVHGVIDPMFGPLADNGGFALPDGNHILTHAPLPGSPAIDAGDPSAVAGVSGVPMSDERGAPFTRVFGGRIDIGAVEYEPSGFLPGDYNRNDIVDAADYTVWRDSRGSSVAANGSGADGNGDGVINDLDYGVWRTNFGATLPVAGGASLDALQVKEVQPPALPGVHATIALRVDGAAIRPLAEPGAAGVLVMRRPFDVAARRDLLFAGWIANRDANVSGRDSSGFDRLSSDAAPDDAAEGEIAAVDSAFALLDAKM